MSCVLIISAEYFLGRGSCSLWFGYTGCFEGVLALEYATRRGPEAFAEVEEGRIPVVVCWPVMCHDDRGGVLKSLSKAAASKELVARAL